MYYKCIFLLGQFVKVISSQTAWMYTLDFAMYLSMIVVADLLGLEPIFVEIFYQKIVPLFCVCCTLFYVH
jgi:hypothetical protein